MASRPPRAARRGQGATFLLVLAAFAVLVGLGTWQIERRAWKADLIATMNARLAMAPAPLSDVLQDAAANPDSQDFRPVRATGSFLHDREMYLAARSYQGQLGYHVVTPLVLDTDAEGADAKKTGAGRAESAAPAAVLVDRGWVPADRQAPSGRAAGQIPGGVTVEGILRKPARPGLFTPDNRPDQNLWYWVDLPAMGARAGLTQVTPMLIEAGPVANPGGLPIGGQTRTNLPNDHLQYALTWYALALALAVLYLVSRRRKADDGNPTHR